MNWEAIGAIGEAVGALAVVVTLLYLANQSKVNTLAINRAACQSTLRGRGESTRFLASDPEISALMWQAADHPDSLSAEQWQRFFLICSSIVRPIELGFLDYEAGRMRDELWQGQRNALVFWFRKPGVQRWLAEYGQTLYPAFETYLLEIVAAYSNHDEAINLASDSREGPSSQNEYDRRVLAPVKTPQLQVAANKVPVQPGG